MLETISEALAETPWWVYVLFIYLIYVGIRSLKTRVIPLTRLIVLPILFTWMSIHSLLSSLQVTPLILSAWFVFTVVGVGLGWIQIIGSSIQVDRKKWLLKIPGSASILVLILIIFASKYYFEYSLAINPQRAAHLDFAIAMIAVYAIIMGLFVGRFACYLYFFFIKKSVELQE